MQVSCRRTYILCHVGQKGYHIMTGLFFYLSYPFRVKCRLGPDVLSGLIGDNPKFGPGL